MLNSNKMVEEWEKELMEADFEPSFMAPAREVSMEKIKSFISSLLSLQKIRTLEEVEEMIDDNIKINKIKHRVGSHSDDYGGESDYPCDCDTKEREYKIEALESLKKRLLAKLSSLKQK